MSPVQSGASSPTSGSASSSTWIVDQYHYLDWPDFGVPEVPSFVHLVRTVYGAISSSITTGASGPIVVHCSAGVGRTGCLLTLFNVVQSIACVPSHSASCPQCNSSASLTAATWLPPESSSIKVCLKCAKVSILAEAKRVREARAFSIQTTGQYQLIYDTLLAFLRPIQSN